MIHRLAIVACVFASAASAAESPAPAPAPSVSATAAAPAPATAPAPPAAPANANAPFLGITVEPAGEFDGAPVLTVTAVVAGSTMSKLGVREGDRLLKLKGTDVKSVDDVATVARSLTIGERIEVTVLRAGQTIVTAGPVERAPRARELSQQTEQLAQEVAELKRLLQERQPGTNLEQTLRLLRQFEADLPKAAAEFKARYPDGEFAISIHIDIRSDKKAADPKPLGDAPGKPAAPPAGPAPAP